MAKRPALVDVSELREVEARSAQVDATSESAAFSVDSAADFAGASDGVPLEPKPVPGKVEAEKPARVRIPKDKKLKTAKAVGKTIQSAIDRANTVAVLAGTGYQVEFSRKDTPSIPVDYRHGKEGLELVYVDGPGQAIAYHAQELGLDRLNSLLKLIDDNPRAVALVGIVGAVAVNAYHVRSVTMQHAMMVQQQRDHETRERIRTAENTPVEGFAAQPDNTENVK